MAILQEIQNGENKKLEFKSQMIENKKIVRTLVAFSNTSGGKFIIGVNDDGVVVGVESNNVPQMIDSLVNLIDDSCTPQIRPSIYSENIMGKTVVVVEVFPGSHKPYYMKSEGFPDGVYVRIGTTTRKADSQTIRELERERENIGFDEEICFQLARNLDFETNFIKTFNSYAKKTLEEKDLINLKLLKAYGGNLMPTNAYAMLIDKSNYFEFTTIKCARFKGNDVTRFIDRKEFTLPLYEQIENSIKFCEMYIALGGVIEGAVRVDTYAIPMTAIREAVTNAIVHRDYSKPASVTINIFDDRIEIISPGGLPGMLDIEQIKSGRSEVRNRVIARVLKEMNFIEQWGTGINRIISECKIQNLKEPDFSEVGQGFKVVIYSDKQG